MRRPARGMTRAWIVAEGRMPLVSRPCLAPRSRTLSEATMSAIVWGTAWSVSPGPMWLENSGWGCPVRIPTLWWR